MHSHRGTPVLELRQVLKKTLNPMAETQRMRKLHERPIYVERLLNALIVRAGLVPSGAYPIRSSASVPTELTRIAKLAVRIGRAWSCWVHGEHTWLFIGEMPLDVSRERGAPVLQVDVYHGDGLRDAGLWMPGQDGKWHRCTTRTEACST
jgi:hypothetical protein